jgi:hypothetical protein
MKKRGQAAMEFLMTYGWAILVVLSAIGALAYFGVLNPSSFLPSSCTIAPGFGCDDFRITDTFVEIVLRNGMGNNIVINNISMPGCTGIATGSLNNGEQSLFRINGCSFPVSSRISEEIYLTYTTTSNLAHQITGKVTGKSEQSVSTLVTLLFREDGTFTNTTYDAEIRENNPTTNYGNAPSLTVDQQTPHSHAVIQFPNIIGYNDGQIPPGTIIDSATLTVNCFNTGDNMNAYLLLEEWTESEVTWNDRKTGTPWSDAGANGVTSRDLNGVPWACPWPTTGNINFDMTYFMQEWSDNMDNYGIVVIETGGDGTDWTTRDDPIDSEKPLLQVTYTEYN